MIIDCSVEMKKFLGSSNITLLFLLTLISFPVLQGFGQIQTDTGEGVFFVNSYPYSFKDNNGYTIVLGEIINKHNFPISNVKILVSFYGQISDEPIDSVIGNTILNVLQPQESSPFVLKSSMPNSSISRVGATLLGFDSSPEIPISLLIKTNSLEISNSLVYSGQITNTGNNDATDIRIHLISLDIFDPPRVVNISSITLENTLSPGNSQAFLIDSIFNTKSATHYIIAESDNYQSQVEIIDDQKIISQNKIITINEVNAINIKQNNSIIFSPVRIQAQILMQEFTPLSIEESSIFYVQVKDAESGLVEFVSSSNITIFEDSPKDTSIIWIPEKEGLFFIETYLWDSDNVVLSAPGEVLLVHVNAA